MNRKGIPNSYDHEENHEAIKAIQQSLQSLDNHYSSELPNLEWFEQMIICEKERLRKKLVTDIMLFAFIAIFILSLIIFSLYKLPIVFFIAQGAVILLCLLYGGARYIKQVNMNER